ncbi:hypothetical protein [Streptococcus chenjunshii]|uniref:hypothetical protein n=1 Tax=Streptococcus chenjunshii TaxID=2173853 RepID=UPI0013C2FC1E|nr:hypothetical protein [Streptococcus chenjunshii]
MKLKKLLFGNINYSHKAADGSKEVSFSLKGGLLPSLLVVLGTAGLLVWLWSLVF